MRITINNLDKSRIKRSGRFNSLGDVVRFERSPPVGAQPNSISINVDGLPFTPPFKRSGGFSPLRKNSRKVVNEYFDDLSSEDREKKYEIFVPENIRLHYGKSINTLYKFCAPKSSVASSWIVTMKGLRYPFPCR